MRRRRVNPIRHRPPAALRARFINRTGTNNNNRGRKIALCCDRYRGDRRTCVGVVPGSAGNDLPDLSGHLRSAFHGQRRREHATIVSITHSVTKLRARNECECSHYAIRAAADTLTTLLAGRDACEQERDHIDRASACVHITSEP